MNSLYSRFLFGTCLLLLAAVLMVGDAAAPAMESIFQIALIGLTGLILFDRWTAAGPVPLIRIPGSILWGLFILSIFLQALPLPRALLGGISPHGLQDWMEVSDVLAAAGTGHSPAAAMPAFSVAYSARRAAAAGIRLAALTAFFYLLLAVLKSEKDINRLMWVVTLCGLARAGRLLISPAVPAPAVTELIEIGVLLSAGLYRIYKKPVLPLLDEGLGKLQTARQALMHRLSADGFNVMAVLSAIAGTVMLLSLVKIGATASLIRAAAALLVSALCLRLRRLPHIGTAAALLLAAAVSAMVAVGYGSPGVAHLMNDYRLWGVGAGCAADLLPRYADWAAPQFGIAVPAAGRMAAISMETGLAGLLLLAIAGIRFIHPWIHAWTRRHDWHARGTGFAAMAACLAFLFGNSGPAFSEGLMPAAAFTAALAAGVAAVHRRGRGLMQTFDYPSRALNFPRALKTGAAIASLLLCLTWGALLASSQLHLPETGETAASADGTQLLHHLTENPASGEIWMQLAKSFARNDADALAYLDRWLPLADRCYGQAVQNRPADADILFEAGRYWVQRSAMLPDTPDAAPDSPAPDLPRTRPEGIRRFQELFRQALTLDPGRLQAAAESIRPFYSDDAVTLDIVPETDTTRRAALLHDLLLEDAAAPIPTSDPTPTSATEF